jgi:hypothetical protein
MSQASEPNSEKGTVRVGKKEKTFIDITLEPLLFLFMVLSGSLDDAKDISLRQSNNTPWHACFPQGGSFPRHISFQTPPTEIHQISDRILIKAVLSRFPSSCGVDEKLLEYH